MSLKSIKLNCLVCKKDISKYTRDIKRNKNNYCSRECYDSRRKENLTRLKRGTKYYLDLIESSKCECGETSNYLLQIHHIDGNHKNNTPDNLEILCGNCHIKRHLKLNKKGVWVYHPKSLTDRSLLNIL